ncbi:MAG: YdcF family protein [Methylococcaceae bacterium]|nr:YdcF family protein [Methylococcaceae bacterium]
MNIWITYIIKTLLLPQTSLLLLILLGTLLLIRGRKNGFPLILSALTIWYLLSTPIVATVLIKSVETYPPLQPIQLDTFKAQAIVVLGGGIRPVAPEYNNQPTVAPQTLERLRYAAKWARATKLPILVSGGRVLEQDQPAEAEIMAQTLAEDYGVKARWQESQSRNTAENARFSYAFLSKQQITKIVLITHALHMPRAVEEFRRSGFEILPAAVGYVADDTPNNILSFLPSAKAFMLSSMAIHETIGRLWRQLNRG